jgi:hypothetical protein
MTATPPEPPPGHPFTPAQVRALRIAVIVMGVLIVLGVIALIFGMARQAQKMASRQSSSTAVSAPALSGASTVPQSVVIGDAEVGAMTLAGNVLAIHTRPLQPGAQQRSEAKRGEIILYDIQAGREVGRIKLE